MVPLEDTINEIKAISPSPIINRSSFPHPSSEQYLGNVAPTSTQVELAIHHHHSLGSPPKLTFLVAIQKHPELFTIFPALTYE
jgi:hypothetical protein